MSFASTILLFFARGFILMGFFSLWLPSCKKERAHDYTARYSGSAHYVSNKRCYGCPLESIDTTFTDLQVNIVKGQKEGTWTMTVDTEAPHFYKSLEIIRDAFTYFDASSPGTEVTDINGQLKGDSLVIVHQFTVHSGNWQSTKTIRVAKRNE